MAVSPRRAALRNARHAAATMDTLVSLGVVAATAWSLYAIFVQVARPAEVSRPAQLLRFDGAIYLAVAAVALRLATTAAAVKGRDRRGLVGQKIR